MTTASETQLPKVEISRKRSSFPTQFLLIALCLFCCGVVHGLWTSRWNPPDAPDGSKVLDRVPGQIGNWVGTELDPLDHPEQLKSLNRVYTNELTGRSVTVMLLAGEPDIVAAYPLTQLLAGHGYRSVGDAIPVSVESSYKGITERVHHGFLNTDYYEPSSLRTEQLIAVRAWTENGIWESPFKPLDRFADSPEVFRLYVTQKWDFAADTRPNDIEDFLTTAIPKFSAAVGYEPKPPAKEAPDEPAAEEKQ